MRTDVYLGPKEYVAQKTNFLFAKKTRDFAKHFIQDVFFVQLLKTFKPLASSFSDQIICIIAYHCVIEIYSLTVNTV